MVTRIGSSFPLRQIMTTRLSLGCRAALEGREEFRVISACAGAAAVAGRNYVGSVVDLRQNVRFLTLDTAVAEACFVVEGSKKTYHFHSFVGVVMWEQDLMLLLINIRKTNDASEITNNMPEQQAATNCNWQRRTHISYQKTTNSCSKSHSSPYL